MTKKRPRVFAIKERTRIRKLADRGADSFTALMNRRLQLEMIPELERRGYEVLALADFGTGLRVLIRKRVQR